jgi:Na+/melibiose symporter-like transporter
MILAQRAVRLVALVGGGLLVVIGCFLALDSMFPKERPVAFSVIALEFVLGVVAVSLGIACFRSTRPRK